MNERRASEWGKGGRGEGVELGVKDLYLYRHTGRSGDTDDFKKMFALHQM